MLFVCSWCCRFQAGFVFRITIRASGLQLQNYIGLGVLPETGTLHQPRDGSHPDPSDPSPAEP